MARQAYEITSSAPAADHIAISPDTWYSVGAVQTVQLLNTRHKDVLLVNTKEEEASALNLRLTEESILEDSGRVLYVKGVEGHRFVTDDGVA